MSRATPHSTTPTEHPAISLGRGVSILLCTAAAVSILLFGLLLYYDALFVAAAYTRPFLFGLRSGGPNTGHWITLLPEGHSLSTACILTIGLMVKEFLLARRLVLCILLNMVGILLPCAVLVILFLVLLFS
ncbi:MAG: hypothetical protein AAGA29_05440 [Planctomycetota bacterium]